MLKPGLLHLLWVLWLLVICFLSLTPGNKLPDIQWKLISIDTVAHFGFYFVLAFLQLLAFQHSKKIKSQFLVNLSNPALYMIVILAGIAIGYGIELVQKHYIYQRYYDFEDILVNGIGTIFGAFTFGWTGRKLV